MVLERRPELRHRLGRLGHLRAEAPERRRGLLALLLRVEVADAEPVVEEALGVGLAAGAREDPRERGEAVAELLVDERLDGPRRLRAEPAGGWGMGCGAGRVRSLSLLGIMPTPPSPVLQIAERLPRPGGRVAETRRAREGFPSCLASLGRPAPVPAGGLSADDVRTPTKSGSPTGGRRPPPLPLPST